MENVSNNTDLTTGTTLYSNSLLCTPYNTSTIIPSFTDDEFEIGGLIINSPIPRAKDRVYIFIVCAR